jgi:hypothetical protein
VNGDGIWNEGSRGLKREVNEMEAERHLPQFNCHG